MLRARPTTLAMAISLVALCLAVPAAAPAAKGSASTEHGVNRANLAQKAISVIEQKNGIDVLKISRCGPRKRKGAPDFSRWTCYWRAGGEYSGQVPYACAGKARWKRKGNRWVVEPCKNRMQPLAPLLEAPNPHPTFGFNDDWIFAPTSALNMLDRTGATVARTSLAWSGVEASPGGSNWYGTDQLYANLQARGIKPLWSVIDAPCWAQPDPAACSAGKSQLRPAPAYYDELAAFAVAAAKRYPDSVGIEVWNEPNYPKFWGGWPEPDLYAKMLKEVAGALHREVPGMAVVSGGLSPHADSDKKAIGFSNFLTRMYELGAAQEADAIGIHPYPGVGPNEDYIADVRVYLGKIQQVMAKHGEAAKPMWATEFGVSSAGENAFEPSHQAAAMAEIYDTLRHVNRIDLAVIHRFIEHPEMAGREAGFGVVSQNLAPKPVFCQLGSMLDQPLGLC